MTETEILLQLWADILADVQTDKVLQAAHHFGTDGARARAKGRVLGCPLDLLHEKTGALPGEE